MSKIIRILFVEDNEDEVDLLLKELKHHWLNEHDIHSKRVETKKDLILALDEEWDVVLSGYALPEFDGLKVLLTVKEKNKDLPFILVSGSVGEQVAVDVMKHGADDYIMKDNLNRLAPAIENGLETHELRKKIIQREIKLLEQREFSDELIESAPDGIAGINEKVEIIFFNKQAEFIFGYDRDEVLGKPLEILMTSRSGRKLDQLTVGYFDNPANKIKMKSVHELIGKRKNGKEFPVGITLSYLQTTKGKIAITSIRDISERKKSEEALKATETRYRRLFESAQDGILILDGKTGKILDANPYLLEILGYNCQEILGKELWEIGAFKDIPASKEAFLDLQKEEYIRYDDLPLKTKDGRALYVEFVSNVYLVNDEKVIQCNIRDITERKQAELVLLQKNIELQKSNSELDRFVYSTAHDLRSPLTSLLGLISIIDTNTNAEQIEQKELIKMMDVSVKKLDNFIGDIISYSRNSRTEIEAEVINFDELVKETIAKLKYMNGASNITSTIDINQKTKFISDKIRIGVLLTNLFSNSVKYQDTDNKNSSVLISIQVEEKNATIIIEDNGIGIDKKYHKKIFDMFFRGSKLSTGSGLGMFIVKETIEKLNGTIKLESELKKGCKFIITLPNII